MGHTQHLTITPYVIYRYGVPDYSAQDIYEGWDVRLHRLLFYYWGNDEWAFVSDTEIEDHDIINAYTGQSHPDVAINHYNGDIYYAWTELNGGSVDLFYKRYDGSSFYGPFSLESTQRPNDPWFVNLDVGLVAGLPGSLSEIRVVGFCYTAVCNNQWEHDPDDDLWGVRPVVGWWQPGTLGSDNDHPAQVIIVNRADFDPEEPEPPGQPNWGNHFIAGLPRLDIPSDNATDHGAAIVFIQDTDTTIASQTVFEVYGISSLDYSGFTHISVPSVDDEYNTAVLPSLAIHSSTGNTAGVTYMARNLEDAGDDWSTFATFWEIDDVDVISDPTQVDLTAEGEFDLDIEDNHLFHNWGTGSGLIDIGDDDYWAAWSDKMLGASPHEVHAAFGFATP
jgi:hypothetical protein